MEFDTNFRDDFLFLSSLFSDTPPKPTNVFSLGASSSKGSFDNLHHFDQYSPLISNGSNLNPHHIYQFSCEGTSSSNPLSGVQTPYSDPFDQAYANGFLKDPNAHAFSLFAPDGKNGNMHDFESSLGHWDYSQNNMVLPRAQSQIYYLSLNVQEPASANGRYVDDVSCITAENVYDGIGDQKKRSPVHTRKADRVQKKTNIIKGQWTPQEDRYIKNHSTSSILVNYFFFLFFSFFCLLLTTRMLFLFFFFSIRVSSLVL